MLIFDVYSTCMLQFKFSFSRDKSVVESVVNFFQDVVGTINKTLWCAVSFWESMENMCALDFYDIS